MEKIKVSRRGFVKYSILALGGLTTLSKKGPVLSNLFAKDLLDATVNKQGYVHDILTEVKKDKKYETHVSQVLKELTKLKRESKADSIHPQCKNCKQYVKVDKEEKGFGSCAMVGATKKDVQVAETGWCKVWMIDKKKVEAFSV